MVVGIAEGGRRSTIVHENAQNGRYLVATGVGLAHDQIEVGVDRTGTSGIHTALHYELVNKISLRSAQLERRREHHHCLQTRKQKLKIKVCQK